MAPTKNFLKPSLTDQRYKDSCTINLAVKNLLSGRKMVNLNQVQGFFGDVSNVVDYRQALDTIRATQEAFDSLPVEIRKLCQNNPENLIEVMNNKDNVEILQKNGMLQKGEEAKLEDVVEVLKSIKQGVGTENLVTMVPTDTNGVKNVSRETMEENK